MMVHQSNTVSPLTSLTPVSTPPGGHHHASDLSPRSSNSSYVSTNDSILNQSAGKDNVRGMNSPEDFSALQRLQFALERNALFSTLLNDHDGTQPSRLVKPCQGSSSSSLPESCSDEKNHSVEESIDMTNTSIRTPASSPEGKNYRGEESLNMTNGIRTPTSSPELKNYNAAESMNMANGIRTPASSPEDSTNTANIIFQCPLCSVVSNSRHEFNEHLVTHSQQHACPRCPYLTENEDCFKTHLQEFHDLSEFEVLTDDEVRTPKTNSQGKTKLFKCKQCGYSAVTKLDFWEHTKTHIRQEKMLTCPKCPFVTEYKHHLEYHLRNHFGSKPFQCNKCAYSCVNKSMLNSHLKSHSSIYQYRCADCSYATKYCHSLKLHLRKYDHKPSMVLNPDGTPNPLPIIDVYGTRRGPKIKRQDQTGDDTSSDPASPTQKTPKKQRASKGSNDINNRASNNICSTPPVSPLFADFELKREFSSPNMFSPNQPRIEDSNQNHNGVRNNNINFQQVQQPAIQMPMTAVNSAAAFQLQNFIMQNTANNATMERMMKNPMEAYAVALNQYMRSNPAMHMSSPLELTKAADDQRAKLFSQIRHQIAMGATQNNSQAPAQVVEVPQRIVNPEPLNLNIHAPLDLRNPRTAVENNNNRPEEIGEDMKKRKRKGKALRYDRRKEMKQDFPEEDSNDALDFSNNNNNTKMPNMAIKKEMDNESLVCKYCDISFPPVLYSLHMRFHSSDADPFRCNVCGTRSAEKVSFFVHLATASH